MMIDVEKVEKAYRYAAKAHYRQTRKYTRTPYIEHPVAVANLVASVGGSTEMVQAALLHDVVEDTSFTLMGIQRNFGTVVAAYVDVLTDPPLEAGNRKTRKEIQRNRLSKGGYAVHTIKVADMIHNAKSIAEYDPNFWKVYREEAEQTLQVLYKAPETLTKVLQEIINETSTS
jgi:(p)ppGpp synthase/HD superfamily hydrolase